MAPYSPPPLHTPVSPAPIPALKAQWNTLHHCLEGELGTTWPASIDRSVFATALVKMTTELELLRSEVHRAKSSQFHIELLDYDTSDRSTSVLPLPCTLPDRPASFVGEARPKAGSFAGRRPTPSPALDFVGSTLTVTIPEGHNSPGLSGYDQLTPISPFSPSFGPRLGQIPSGTMSRRRSGRHNKPLEFRNVRARGAKAEQAGEGARNIDWEKKVQWEAAWAWIESNLETYVPTFGKNVYVHATRYELWKELVKLREEAVELEDTLGEARNDSDVSQPAF